MATFKKKDLNELVGGDVFAGGNDRNVTSNSEIETGPVQKPFNDDSDYEKGISTTTDRAARYHQQLPWFVNYFGSTRTGRGTTYESTNKTIVKKNTVEEKIEDLVKKSKDTEVTEKGYNPKISKMIDAINDCELSDKQLEDLEKAIVNKKNNSNTTKNL